MRGMHQVGAEMSPMPVRSFKRRSSILDEDHAETEIARHARRRRNTMIGRQADDHQVVNASIMQIGFEFSANECTVDALDKNRFTRERPGFRLEFGARSVRS